MPYTQDVLKPSRHLDYHDHQRVTTRVPVSNARPPFFLLLPLGPPMGPPADRRLLDRPRPRGGYICQCDGGRAGRFLTPAAKHTGTPKRAVHPFPPPAATAVSSNRRMALMGSQSMGPSRVSCTGRVSCPSMTEPATNQLRSVRSGPLAGGRESAGHVVVWSRLVSIAIRSARPFLVAWL